jgi:hypothetical protein
VRNPISHIKKGHLYVLVALCLVIALGQTYATYLSTGLAQPNRVITQKFEISVGLHSEIKDLYSWEATITFNPSALVVLDVKNGEFLSANSLTIDKSNLNPSTDSAQLKEGDSMFVVSYDDAEFGKLALAETKVGSVSGTSGTGTLATITFGVFGQGSYNLKLQEALLYDSKLNPIEQVLLTGPTGIS